MSSTMGVSGMHRQHQDSANRFSETRGAQPPQVIIFRAATRQQILDAMREEEYHGIPLDIELTKQGLYNPEDRGSIFHPQNIKALDIPQLVSSINIKDNGVYEIRRESYDTLLQRLREKSFRILESN